jgi:hypothetical protein
MFAPIRPAFAQVVINEIVEDQQDFESGEDTADTREFVELYNAGATPVDISGWTLTVQEFSPATGSPVIDTLPSGSIIAPGGYFVIGGPGIPDGPNVYKPFAGELWGTALNAKAIFELRDPDQPGPTTLVDAVALDTFRGNELDTATQEQLDQIGAGQTAGVGARGGWWGQIESNDPHPSDTVNYPNLPMSIGRYRDGYDHNVNGRDFGMIPATPGATNNLAEVNTHAVPDVDAVATGTNLRDDYYASFKLPRVINPTAVGPTFGGANINPSAIPASPQGGNAIIAWDETGGGNVVYSDEYSNEFKIYAYIDPTPFNNTTNTSTQSEASVYGIAGSSDMFFGTPNSADLLTGQPGTGGNITSSANGSTGLGWLIQRRTSRDATGVNSSAAVLQLIDFNDGGDGVLADNDWQIEHQVDLTGMAAGWHVLGIDYDPVTGNVTAVYDNTTINFTTTTDLVGNFYVGWREQLPGTGSSGRPPTYDLFEETNILGDHNLDGTVDAADYVMWRKQNPGAPNTHQGYLDWKANFGEPQPGSGGNSAVPEPSSVVLALVSLVGLALSRRGR